MRPPAAATSAAAPATDGTAPDAAHPQPQPCTQRAPPSSREQSALPPRDARSAVRYSGGGAPRWCAIQSWTRKRHKGAVTPGDYSWHPPRACVRSSGNVISLSFSGLCRCAPPAQASVVGIGEGGIAIFVERANAFDAIGMDGRAPVFLHHDRDGLLDRLALAHPDRLLDGLHCGG